MANRKGGQIGVQLSDQERELLETVAKKLGKPLAAVLREAAMNGLDDLIEKMERRQKFLSQNADTSDG